MERFASKCAYEINRLQGWEGSVFSSRYRSICVTHESAAQIERLEYLLSNSVNEHLVSKVEHWPGVHFGKTLLEGRERHWAESLRASRLPGREVAPTLDLDQQLAAGLRITRRGRAAADCFRVEPIGSRTCKRFSRHNRFNDRRVRVVKFQIAFTTAVSAIVHVKSPARPDVCPLGNAQTAERRSCTGL